MIKVIPTIILLGLMGYNTFMDNTNGLILTGFIYIASILLLIDGNKE